MSFPTDDESKASPEGLTGILDALAESVTRARAMPMSSSVLVSRAELLDLVDQARDVLPTQLTRADEVLADADAARTEAHVKAQALLDSAKERADGLVSKEEVVHAAQARAVEIIAAAEAEAARLRREADDYCDRRLADFEIDLGKVIAQVQAGRAKLAGRLDESGA